MSDCALSHKEIIDELKAKGFTKWKIAKELGVSWRTVHLWHKGFTTPQPKTGEKLWKLYGNWTKRHTTD